MYTKGEKIVPVALEEQMQTSYIDYSMSVIVGRALPDARDGLKPVHRRILYAMSELGLEHNKPYKKCARITGETLGKFHPHGDMAVYDALVRMVQDFSLRYPLIDGQGNFGSVDGDFAAAMRYCVSGDSRIITEKGLQKIEKILHHSEVSFQTLSINNKINHVSKWFDSGEHPTRLVETHRGFSLCGSLNHPILTWQNGKGKPHFKWKLLGNIKRGDYAVINRSNLLFPKKEPSLVKYYPKIKNRVKIHKLPRFMDENLAFILGAIVSEGSIGREQIGFCNNDKEFIREFKKSFKKVFPDCRLHEFNRKPSGYTKKNYTSLEIHSIHVIRFLENLGLSPCRAREKVVPEIVFLSSKRSVASFLRGFAEGDGSVYISSSLNNLEICFISASKKLMQDLQILLLRFGIDSSYRFQRTRNVYKLFIRNYINLNLFKKQINFVTKKKQKKLNEISKRNSSGWVMSKMDFIPYLSGYIRKKDKYQGFVEWLIRHNIDRYTKIERHWADLKKILGREDLRLYENLRKNRYIFDRVVSVKNSGIKRVYSIKVDSPCHSFISNGFISHNTEARLAEIAEELLADIDKNTVNFRPNFDESLQEPVVLPSKLPNLIINGSSGIAVGMATNIPPHNLVEVVEAVKVLIDDPQIQVEKLMKHIQGPDFPTGGIIYGLEEVRNTYLTGRGRIRVRARAGVEPGKSGKECIVITEIPYMVNKSALIEEVAVLVQNKKIDGITDIRDESDKEGMRVVIELRRGENAQVILNQLYKHTKMEETFGAILLALDHGKPVIMDLKHLLQCYIAHRKDVVYRRTRYDLEKAEARAHILEGFKIALKHIDEVVGIIKKAKDRDEARNKLIVKFKLTEIQANAILDMRLYQLTGLEQDKIEKEYLELIKKIEYLKSLLASEKKILGVIKDELDELVKKYGDSRRTEIVGRVEEIKIEDLIAKEGCLITISHKGYIKRVPVATYKPQRRGGKGVSGMEVKEEDFVEHLFTATTHDYILFFTEQGKAYWLKVYEIPQGGRLAKGKAIVNMLNMGQDEKIAAMVRVEDFEKPLHLVMATRKGYIKKTELSEFSNPRSTGIIAINVEKGDGLIGVELTTGNDEIILIAKGGKSIRFSEAQCRPMGRTARGVIGFRLAPRDEVVCLTTVSDRATLLLVTENGYGKRSDFGDYRIQRRGGKGIIGIKVTKKIGSVVKACKVASEDEMVLISSKGKMIRISVEGIRVMGRATQGVRLITLGSDEKLEDATVIMPEEEE